MNFIYLSPHFPPNFRAFCKNLANAGVRVLGIADAPYDELGELKDCICEYYRVSSLEDYDQVYRAAAFFIHKYGRIDGIASMNEYWLETEAKLRTDFNIPGIKAGEILWLRRKSLMKIKFRNAGVPVADGRVIRTPQEAAEMLREKGAIVAKPDDGMGASNTFKITDQQSLEKFLREKSDSEYIAEEFIPGNICTFDGLADRYGNIVFAASHVYESAMDLVNQRKSVAIYSYMNIPDDLMDMGMRTAREFNVRSTFFHFEFFRTPEGRIVALEINMRPPGGYMIDMCNYSCDTDLYRAWADIITEKPVDIRWQHKKYSCAFASRRTRERRYARSNEEIFSRFGSIIVMADRIPGVLAEGMGDFVYIARSSNPEELKSFVSFVHQEI